jgi:glycosyltransferase A (GT-A) superfamily protein (DUF2064 family)
VNQALLLFTKVPEPGYVKTRLTEGEDALSPEEACSLYSAILLDVFDVMAEVANAIGARLYVAYTPAERETEIRQILSEETVSVSFFSQEGRTTSERIVHALETAFGSGEDNAVLVFGDQPGLSKRALLNAFEALQQNYKGQTTRLVLGPTCDGGTYLIGLTSKLRRWISEAIDCTNSSKAVSKLLLRSSSGQIPYALLEELTDLDDLLDLELLLRRPPTSCPRTVKVLASLKKRRTPRVGTEISVIIPTLNEEETLERSIGSLRGQRPPPKEIVVVDCGSHDRTLQIANELADRIVVVNRCGRAHQENVGAMGAKGDVLLFLHADALVSPALLQSISKALVDPDVAGGGARLAYVPRRLRYRAICALRDGVSERLGIFGMGPSFFVRRRLFHEVGGFDQEINEEGVDMSKRLRTHGRLVMLDEVVQTSARRYELCGFFRTLCAWGFTVALSFLGIHGSSVEKYIWRIIR